MFRSAYTRGFSDANDKQHAGHQYRSDVMFVRSASHMYTEDVDLCSMVITYHQLITVALHSIYSKSG